LRTRFGDFVLDSATRELTRGGAVLPVPPKVFQLLELLLDRRPSAVAKGEIHDQLWPSTFVTESNLARLVAEARAALDDDAREPRFLRTVYGFGYAFCGQAVEDRPVRGTGVACAVAIGGREVGLSQGENVLGRAEDAAVRINSSKASRRHARILVGEAGAVLEDMGSKNGTFLRGQRIEGPCPLADGDEVCVGDVLMTVRFAAGPRSTETASSR
jgi:DNA-binding winged helix-turn-helix (wHTH) protein